MTDRQLINLAVQAPATPMSRIPILPSAPRSSAATVRSLPDATWKRRPRQHHLR